MTRSEAIQLKCRECIFDQYAYGTWREQAANCTSTTCPLFDFRPKPLPCRKQSDLLAKQPEKQV